MADKYKPIRWTLRQAGAEFNIDPQTLSKRCRAQGVEPGEDGKLSTLQVMAAVAGDIDREKTRNEAAKADLNEMKRDVERGRTTPTEITRQLLEEVGVALRQIIDHSALNRKGKEAIYSNIRKLGERDFVTGTSNGAAK